MDREHIYLLMNRAIDGAASVDEREELARALKADPLLRSEYEDVEATHVATTGLFKQLALPEDFNKRVLRRIQGVEVPADETAEIVRLPQQRNLHGREAKVVSIHRRRARLYAAVAFLSAAAALILGIGVITGAFAGNASTKSDANQTAVDGSRGVPDDENPTPHRDSHPQLPPDDGVAPKGDALVNDGGAPKQPEPGPGPRNDGGPKVEEPKNDKPEPEQPTPEPKPDDVVDDQPAPEPVPDEVVEDQPAPGDGPEETEATAREVIGRLLILNGSAELVAADGSVARLDEDQAIYAGDRIRTKFNAVVMLQLTGGDVTLGVDTEVSVVSEEAIRLEAYSGKEKGEIALDRNNSHSGDSIAVVCNDYSLYLMNGVTVLERDRHGLTVTKAIGFATITHDSFGSVLLPEDSGYEAKVEFGKEFKEPKAVQVKLPDWSGETRSKAVMLALADVIGQRKFSKKEDRNYLNSKLPGKLDKVLMYPTTTDSVFEFLSMAVEREQFKGYDIVKMAGEVENAYAEVTELQPDAISRHATRAAMVAEDYDQWRDYFYRLMRPPVQPADQPQPAPVPTPSSDCPNSKKMKKIVPPPPVNKPVPVPHEED